MRRILTQKDIIKTVVAMEVTAGNSQTTTRTRRKINMGGKILIIITIATVILMKIQQIGATTNHRISRLIPITKWDGMMVAINGMIKQILIQIIEINSTLSITKILNNRNIISKIISSSSSRSGSSSNNRIIIIISLNNNNNNSRISKTNNSITSSSKIYSSRITQTRITTNGMPITTSKILIRKANAGALSVRDGDFSYTSKT